MSEILDDIRTEAQALRQSFALATARSGELNAAAEALTANLDVAEKMIGQFVSAARSGGKEIESDLGDAITRVENLVVVSGSKAREAAEEADLLFAMVTNSRESLNGRKNEAIQAAGTLLKEFEENTIRDIARVGQLESALDVASTQLNAEADQLVSVLGDADKTVKDLDKAWQGHRDQWIKTTADQLAQVEGTCETGVHEPTKAAAESFRTLCETMSAEVLTNPINALATEVQKEVSDELRSSLKEIIDEVNELLAGFMSTLLDSRDDGDKVDEALDKVMALIEPVWNQLYAQFKNVESIDRLVPKS